MSSPLYPRQLSSTLSLKLGGETMQAKLYSLLVLLILSSGVSLIVFRLVHKSLCNLLDEVVKLPDCTTFYSRILFIGLVFIAVSSALSFNLKDESAFIEYVWKIGSGLADVFNSILWFLLAYLVILTILIAVLRKKCND